MSAKKENQKETPKRQKSLYSFFSLTPNSDNKSKSNGDFTQTQLFSQSSLSPKDENDANLKNFMVPTVKGAEVRLSTVMDSKNHSQTTHPPLSIDHLINDAIKKVDVDAPDEPSPEQSPIKKKVKLDSAAGKNCRRRVVMSSDEEEGVDDEEEGNVNAIKEKFAKRKLASEAKSDHPQSHDEDQANVSIHSSGKRPKPSALISKAVINSPILSSLSPLASSSKGGKKGAQSSRAANLLDSFCADDGIDLSLEDSSANIVTTEYEHQTLEFLQPDKIRDLNKRRPDDENYDSSTLYVPESYLKQKTPGMKQWWSIKSEHFDTVLFFKVGKFYEMYHMDAELTVKNLNLTYMRGAYAHCGFPETAEGRMSTQMVERGFKVARVEQTETPDQMEQRRGKNAKGPKVIRRELCRITTPGTLSNETGLESAESAASDRSALPQFLLAVIEVEEEGGAGGSSFGVCTVDTKTGTFNVGQFTDSFQRSKLITLLAHYPPSQILFEKGKLSVRTQNVFRSNLGGSVMMEPLSGKNHVPSPIITLKMLGEKKYLGSFGSNWPNILCEMVDCRDPLGQTALPDCEVSIRACGMVMKYLESCLIDVDLVSMRQFRALSTDVVHSKQTEKNVAHGVDNNEWFKDRLMVLDGMTLTNLDIIGGSSDSQSSLFQAINYAVTPFGKRLLRQWTCAPLCDPVKIEQRQQAVENLIRAPRNFTEHVDKNLRSLPDLQKALQRAHSLGSKYRTDEHPDGRAVLFDRMKINKGRVADLLSVVAGFKTARQISQLYQKCSEIRCEQLDECLGNFPDIHDDLRQIEQSFNAELARKEGVIIPNRGADSEFDNACAEIENIDERFTLHLRDLKQTYKCPNLKFVGTGKNRYQVEFPVSVATKVPSDFLVTSDRKGFKRYWTPFIQNLIVKLTEAEDTKSAVLNDIMRRVFALFYPKAAVIWAGFLSLILGTCLAEFQGVLKIVDGFHPSLAGLSNVHFIPNDTCLGGEQAPVMLLTGPNMGGKSTLMRQVALLVVIAQIVKWKNTAPRPRIERSPPQQQYDPLLSSQTIRSRLVLAAGASDPCKRPHVLELRTRQGSPVPASSMEFTPVDRIFTRLGANDRIYGGQSTFHVELAETKEMIENASPHSLCIVDELGRGTATHDGTALASACLAHIARQISCRTIFSTHYHTLNAQFSSWTKTVQLQHMSCMVEKADDEYLESSDCGVENEKKDDDKESITFLYKLKQGPCPKSYGFHAARLAGVPNKVLKRGMARSKEVMSSGSGGHSVSDRLNALIQFSSSEKNSDQSLLEKVSDFILTD